MSQDDDAFSFLHILDLDRPLTEDEIIEFTDKLISSIFVENDLRAA